MNLNILSLFPAIPLLMMLGLWISRNTKQIHAVMVAGSSALLALAVWLVFAFLGMRADGHVRLMADEDRCQGILYVVLSVERRGIRILHIHRPVHHVYVL